jgi:hypothetical protein
MVVHAGMDAETVSKRLAQRAQLLEDAETREEVQSNLRALRKRIQTRVEAELDEEIKAIVSSSQLIAYRYLEGDGTVHFAVRSASDAAAFVSQSSAAGRQIIRSYARPINWLEMSSSNKDQWDERMMQDARATSPEMS